MKNLFFAAILAISVAAPNVLFAATSSSAKGLAAGQGSNNDLATFIRTAVEFINSVLIPAVLALAFLVFVWGVFLYFVKGGADDEAQSKGKQLMLYAIGGFVLILIFFGVVNLLTTTIGLKENTIAPTEIPGISVPPKSTGAAPTSPTSGGHLAIP